MSPFLTGMFTLIAGLFTLAFNYRESFDKLKFVMFSAGAIVGGAIVGFWGGTIYGRSGVTSFDGTLNTAVWTFNVVMITFIIADWLAPKGK